MKSFLKNLFADEEIVVKSKEAEVAEAQLYRLLFSGKITLKEYLIQVRR